MRGLSRGLKIGLATVTLLFLAGGIQFYRHQEQRLKEQVEADLLSIASLKVDQIAGWRAERLADAEIISGSPHVAKSVAALLADPQSEAREMLLSTFRLRATAYHYSEILLVDSVGKTRLSLGGELTPLDEVALQELSSAFREQRPIIADLDLDSSSGMLCIGVIAPLFSLNGAEKHPIGAIMLEADARQFLYPLIQSWPVPSRSAETILVRRDGDSVVFLNDTRFQKDAALKTHISLKRTDVPSVMAVVGKTGVFHGVNYRGVKVYAALLSVPDSPWSIVAQIDVSEAMASWRMQSLLILGVFFLAIGAIVVAALLLWQRDEKAHYQELYRSATALSESETRYSTTLMSIGDGVIAANADGAIEILNPVAEELTGWTQSEARGRKVEEVFHIVNEETRQIVVNPLHRVVHEGVVVGLANHTVLISRNGAERQIADSGAPIRDESGKIIGAVLVFRDVTQSHHHQHEREATLRLLQLINDPSQTHDLIRNILTLLQEWFKFDAVGLRMRSGEDFPYYEYQGFSQEFIQSENSLCVKDAAGHIVRDSSGRPLLECMCGNVICGYTDPSKPFFTPRGSFWSNSTTQLLATTTEEERQGCSRNLCSGEGYESVGLFPLKVGDLTLGLLQMNDRTPGRFSPERIVFIESIADQIAIALMMRETQDALQESESTYRSLFENILNGFAYCRMVYDDGRPHDFIYLSVNGAFETQTGLKNVEGKRVSEVIPGILESDPELIERYGRVATTGLPEKFDMYIEALKMWFEISVYSPAKEHFVAVFDVVTDRKRAEEALRESEGKFRNIVETLRTEYFFYRHGLDHVFTYLSPSVTNVLGHSVEEFMTESRRYMTDNPVNLKVAEYTAQSLQGKPQPTYELEVYHKDGSVRLLAVTETPIFDRVGKVIGIEGIAHDVTELKRAENALRDSELELRCILDTTADGILAVNMYGRVIKANQRFADLWRIPSSVLEKGSDQELLEYVLDQLSEPEAFLQKVQALYSSNEEDYDTLTFKDGRVFERYSAPMIARNSLSGRVWSFRDVTERKWAEEALQNSNERLKEAQRIAKIGNWEANLITGELYWSEVIFDIFGFDSKSFVPSVDAFRDAIHPEDRELVIESEIRSELSGLHDVVHRIIRPDNEVRYVHELARRFNDSHGNPVMLRGTVQDLTELKHAEEVIRASEERFRNLFENATVGLYHTTHDGRILLANRAFLDLVGCSSMEDLANRTVEHRGYVDPADAAEFLRRIELDGTISGFESAWKRSDGSPVYVRESARLVRDAEGRTLFYEGIVEDISKHKQAEEENEKLQQQLLHAQKMEAVGRLAGGVAHDFNNMLLAILGNTELALTDLDPDHPLREYLLEIEKAGRRSADLTHQLLAFARKQTVNPVSLDLNEAISGMLKMLRRLIGEDLSLLWKPGHDVRNVKIDPSQIDQILANLTVNARDAITGVGRITIETANVTFDNSYSTDHPEVEPGEYVMLAVSDDGSGIDAKTKERLFEPFFTTKELGKGTGMGLATVFGIVKQNRGFIYVYSEVGQGTTFKIYLPKSDSRSVSAVEGIGWLGLLGGSETVLLVEDEPAILTIGEKMLNLLGYKVLSAASPEEAIALSEEYNGRIDLLLTDVIMPGMNGSVLAQRLTALRPNMKCLFMSGYTSDTIAHHEVLDEGINFLPKPFTAKSLGEKVRTTLNA